LWPREFRLTYIEGDESDVRDKSAPFDVHHRRGSRSEAANVLADLNAQFPGDPVTEVVKSVAQMTDVAMCDPYRSFLGTFFVMLMWT